LATKDARPRPIAPRTLLCSQTELRWMCAAASSCAAVSLPATPRGWATEHPVQPTPLFRRRGEADVAGDLRDGEAQLLRTKCRVERGDEIADLLRAVAGPVPPEAHRVRAVHNSGSRIWCMVSFPRYAHFCEHPRAWHLEQAGTVTGDLGSSLAS